MFYLENVRSFLLLTCFSLSVHIFLLFLKKSRLRGENVFLKVVVHVLWKVLRDWARSIAHLCCTPGLF